MNNVTKLLVCLLFTSHTVFAQENIEVHWTRLKTDLKRRTDVAIFIADSLVKLNQVNQKEVKRVKTTALRLFRYVDTSRMLTRSSVSAVFSLNASLSKPLSRLDTILERRDKLKNSRQFFDLLTPLYGIDNRLNTTRMDFNDACANAHRPDLYFGSYRKSQTIGDTMSKRTYNNHFMPFAY